jgi:prepilin-type N-terminal cleavage/methylation domain-containing protein
MAIFHFTSSIRIAIPTTKKNRGTQSVKLTNYHVNLVAWTLPPPEKSSKNPFDRENCLIPTPSHPSLGQQMKTHTSSYRNRGFTLVELLVVIAIIATLAGIALVAVRSGLAAADAGKTTKNMKEIYGALTFLQSEGVNTGYHAPDTFPPYKGSLQDSQQSSFVWWDLVAEQVDVAERTGSSYRWGLPFSKTILQNPLSKKKLGQGKTEYDSLYNEPDLSLGGYAYNAELGGDVSNDAMEENVYKVRLSAVKDGPSTIYFGETDDNVESHGWVFSNVNNALLHARRTR